MTITHDALDLTILGPPLTCSNLFNLDLTLQQPPPPPVPALPKDICSLQKMYDWQVDGWYPTSMISYLFTEFTASDEYSQNETLQNHIT